MQVGAGNVEAAGCVRTGDMALFSDLIQLQTFAGSLGLRFLRSTEGGMAPIWTLQKPGAIHEATTTAWILVV